MFITINVSAGVNIKKTSCAKKYNWNPDAFSCKNDKQPASIVDDQ